MHSKQLFSQFDKSSTQEWESIIRKDLKGADYNKKLLSNTIDNIIIKPYYRKENLSNIIFHDISPNGFPFLRGNSAKPKSHKIRQDIIVNDFLKANIKAVNIIDNGVTSVGFIIETNEIYFKDFNSLLKGLDLEKVQINFSFKQLSINIIDEFIQFLHTINLNSIDFTVDFDPIGQKTINGSFLDKDYINTLKYFFTKSLPISGLSIININSQFFKDAGSSSVQELAFGLSIANEYLSIAKTENLDIDIFASKIQFTFGIGSNYFMEIAKLRAARYLWSKIVENYGVKDINNSKMKINSVTSDWNKTALDPYVNVLRATTEAMSAIIGGTSSLLVKPFNSSYETSNEFSERIAKNIQIILNEEAYFDKFIDPAGGSYYIENLTSSIIENVWQLFLDIEKIGGYNLAFDRGIIKKHIEDTAKKRDIAIATKKEIILGTNQYANRNEKLDFTILKSKKPTGNAIKLYHGSEAFELLRQRTEKAKKIPKVLIIPFGNLTMRKARASFATNFFACSGFQIFETEPINSFTEAIKQVNNTKAEITVLCSSDDEYLELTLKIYKEIANKTILTIAGYPIKYMDNFNEIGINNFIHAKSNILETLTGFQDIVL